MEKQHQKNISSELSIFFSELFEFNKSSNDTLLLLLIENENNLSEKIIPLINHIINAHHIWNNRIESKELAFGVWEIHKFKDLERLNHSNCARSIELLTDFGPDFSVVYRTTKGENFTNTVQDILFHVINHSAHHRAQIASEMKKCGIEPPVLDYIYYKREH